MNYPYIEYCGKKFSLIEPYTIDDKLIVDFEEYSEFNVVDINRRELCMFTVHTGERFQFNTSIDSIFESRDIRIILQTFLYDCYHRSDYNSYITDQCEHILEYSRITGESILRYVYRWINEQCINISRRGNNLNRYIEKLRLQGREEIDTSHITNRYISINRIETLTARDAFGNEIYTFNPSPSPLPYWFGENEKNKIIHNYNYKPEYKKHCKSDENITTTTLLLGAEIEVDNGGKSEEHARKVLEIMNGKDTWKSEENIYCVRDGSLNNGLEFPTQPGTLEWHKSLPYKEMFYYLDKNGYKAHDTTTCGLHIHINRSFFEDKEMECIGKLMYIIEKFNDEFSILGRRSCRHARFFGYNGEKCKELYSKGYKSRDKYNAINLLHTDTIEIRAFKGTLKYSTFINTLEFVSNLAWYVKNHTEEEIESMSWVDLYKTFSDELKKYYREREQIESEKKKESQKKENVERREVTFTCENARINLDVLRSCGITAEEACRELRASTMIYDDINVNASRMSRECMENVINQFNAVRENYVSVISPLMFVSLSEEETNEKKLKRLKKQLKTEQNYIAKKELNKQISKLQKEIKQEKKRKKHNTNN